MNQENNNAGIPVTEPERQYYFIGKIKELLAGKKLTYHIQTFGCQQNEADSEKIAGMAVAMGYDIIHSPVLPLLF